MANGVIELGEVTRETPVVVMTDRLVPRRALLVLLSIVLVATTAAAAPLPTLVRPVIVPARLGDTMFLDGRRMLLVSGSAALVSQVSHRVVRAYDLPGTRLLSTTTVTVSGGINQVVAAGDTMVVSYQVDASGTWATVAVAEGTEMTRWRRTARLIAVSEADGQALLGTDEAVYAIDLRSGATRWKLPRPPAGYIAETGWDSENYPRWLVLTDSGRLESRDPHTGALLASRTVAPGPGRANVWPVDDLVMADDGSPGFAAYRLPGLIPLWHTGADLSGIWMQAACGKLICTFRQQRGLTAIDPADGRELWENPDWAYAEPVGPYLLATRAERGVDDPGLWVIDPATGRPRGDFGRWEFLAATGDGRFYGKLDVPGAYLVHYGILDPRTLSVRLLGTAADVSNSCQAVAGQLICRLVDASVALWPLR
ncbi:outer membrane protein assembly factor BamB family protein [Paractinoplanes lichenicola]|uniref:PQQ-binding-like beta-propeller repeat protein n=1 Tax=Paractinoplanes lichenicola TaxID=2802976 RepID=A0ABS1VGJ7_9ACTN|nr:PQQ-binding-like beta-propeller repeat protein [Actinoplanes lichenicola]MBL7253738.1 PQQ-binding-like beta-propeller repeat protein [Actinoplanes lichenicola]